MHYNNLKLQIHKENTTPKTILNTWRVEDLVKLYHQSMSTENFQCINKPLPLDLFYKL